MNTEQIFNQFTENTVNDTDLKFEFPHVYGIESRFDFLRAIYSLHNDASHYNWDLGYERLYQIVQHPCCDLSTLIMLYWLNQPIYHLTNSNTENGIHSDSFKFKVYLEKMVKKRTYMKVVEFDLYNFLINTLNIEDELKVNSDKLKLIPNIFFKSAQKDVNYFATYKSQSNKEINISSKKRIYLFGVNPSKIVSQLINCSNVNSLFINVSGKELNQDEILEFNKFKNLESLTFQFWGDISKIDFSVFKNLKELKKVRLITSNNHIEIFRCFPNVESLTLSCNRITSIKGIEVLKKIKILKLDNIKNLKKIDSLSKMENLESVFFKGVSLSNRAYSSILDLKLSSILIDTANLKNLAFLKKDSFLTKSLKKIYLIKNEINTDDFFKELKSLSLNPEIIDTKIEKDFFYK
jgi:hypothetical protein